MSVWSEAMTRFLILEGKFSFLKSTLLTMSESDRCGESHAVPSLWPCVHATLCQWPTFDNNKQTHQELATCAHCTVKGWSWMVTLVSSRRLLHFSPQIRCLFPHRNPQHCPCTKIHPSLFYSTCPGWSWKTTIYTHSQVGNLKSSIHSQRRF